MKKTFRIAVPVIIALISFMILGGCSVDKVDPPAPGGYSGIPATVRVALSTATIASGGDATITATVTEADGEECPNISVTFSVISASSGTFSPATVVTDAEGIASTQFTAASVNTTATIRATVVVGTETISDSAVLTIGTPVRTPTSVSVALSSATTPSTGGAISVTATVTDSSGPISGVTVSFSTSNASAGSLSETSATTNASGIATVTYTANAGNGYVDIRATVGSLNNNSTLQIGTPPPPTPTALNLSIDPASIGINSEAVIKVTLLDSTGAAAFNNPVTLSISYESSANLGSLSSSGTVTTLSLTTDSSGVATAKYYSRANSGEVTIRATSGTVQPQTKTISITSDPASITLKVDNDNLLNGQTTNIEADVRNIMNNAVTNSTVVTFVIASGATNAGTLSASQATTVNGKAYVTFTAAASATGTLIVKASAGTAPVVSAEWLIHVNPASTQGLEFVSATPSVIGIVGSGVQSSSVVKFIAKDINGNPKADVAVSFTLYGPTGATLAAPGGSTNAEGKVDAILQAGTVVGPARIVASATIDGTTYSTSSGNVSIGGGLPSATHFDLSTSVFNLQGFALNGLTADITAWLADRYNNWNILQGTSVSFVAEAGAVNTSNITDAEGLATVVFRTQDPRPTDVTPLVGEPSYTYGGHTYNPRDGWLKVLAMTTGEESFVDNNANGVYDLGESFTDVGEPFIDLNDNGVRNAGEQFFDWPSYVPLLSGCTTTCGAGKHDGGNGVWDPKVPIYRTITLVFTGNPHVGSTALGIKTSRIECTDGAIAPPLYGNVVIPYKESRTFNVYVSDINMNPLIAGTTIDAKLLQGSKGTLITPTPIELLDTPPSLAGPAMITVKVKNEITEKSVQFGDFGVEIGGAVPKTTIYYPGTITLCPAAALAPTGLAAAAGTGAGTINISWTDASDTEEYFAIERKTGAGGAYAQIATVGPDITAYSDSGRTTGTTYYYRVRANNGCVYSAYSNEASAVAP